jgi:hypothetical protein
MSHNKITVDSQNPSATGDIPVNMASYISESSPASNQVIKYDGANWVNANYPGAVSPDLDLAIFGSTYGWSGGSYYYAAGDYFTIRDYGSLQHADSGFNFNNATTTNSPLSNTRWAESIDIPTAGTYLFVCSLAIPTGTSMTMRMSNNAGEFGMKVTIDRTSRYGALIYGIGTCVNNDIFRIVVKSLSGSVKNLDDEEMRTVSYQIYKLS